MGQDGAGISTDVSLVLFLANFGGVITTWPVAADFLVVDASTPTIQCGFARLDDVPREVSCVHGDVLECLPRLINDLMHGRTFRDLEGIIYCYGPGSTLGLRFCVTMINVWQKLATNPMHLFRYSSLEMAANITAFRAPVVTSIGDGGYLVRPISGGDYVFTKQVPDEALFLQTRRWGASFPNEIVKYEISRYDGAIRDILTEIEQAEVFSFKEKTFVKWSHQRHSASEI